MEGPKCRELLNVQALLGGRVGVFVDTFAWVSTA
jgi:hypothetical protein